MSIKEMSVGDRVVLVGNLMGALAVCLTSVGSLLRMQELPDKPLFTQPNEGPVGTSKAETNSANYWERGHL